MKYFLMSDIHIDFWIDLWNDNEPLADYEPSVVIFEKFYSMCMLPADALIVPGDVANDFTTHANFIKWVSTKYDKVYMVMGNHDLVVRGHTFGNGNAFHTSEERIAATKEVAESCGNVYILDGNVVDGIGGCMGMCSLMSKYTWLEYGFAKSRWLTNWFDGKCWAYMNENATRRMNPKKIWESEKAKMDAIVKQSPKIMVTHFCMDEIGVAREYDNNASNAFFYFGAKPFLDQMANDSYWICGHIHSMGTLDYVNESGNTVHLMSVPNAYPGENPYHGINGTFTRESRIIEI